MERVFEVKSKAFFIIFEGFSVAKNCLRPESVPLIIARFQVQYDQYFPRFSYFADFRRVKQQRNMRNKENIDHILRDKRSITCLWLTHEISEINIYD